MTHGTPAKGLSETLLGLRPLGRPSLGWQPLSLPGNPSSWPSDFSNFYFQHGEALAF